eukprot:363316-Chlamydomonas_euryale.AAC.8
MRPRCSTGGARRHEAAATTPAATSRRAAGRTRAAAATTRLPHIYGMSCGMRQPAYSVGILYKSARHPTPLPNTSAPHLCNLVRDETAGVQAGDAVQKLAGQRQHVLQEDCHEHCRHRQQAWPQCGFH